MFFVLASNNQKKINELQRILLPLNIKIKSATEAKINLSNIEESGSTFEENARIKATAFVKYTNNPVIADDSGLMVDALNGEPGIYSARYAGEGASDKQRIEKLLSNLKNIKANDRTAKFVTVICCMFPSGKEILVCGECKGKIAFEPIGENGFGYDPIFIPDNSNGKTFAQLTSDEKDRISHRGKALRKLKQAIEQIIT